MKHLKELVRGFGKTDYQKVAEETEKKKNQKEFLRELRKKRKLK